MPAAMIAAFAPRALLAAATLLAAAPLAHAWGDEGHEVVALVARAHLTPRAAQAVDRLLATDTNGLKMRDGGLTTDSFARQATWADYYRDAQRVAGATPEQIHSYSWHFVDIELQGGSLDKACFGFPSAGGQPASQGPDPDCVVNKIEQFAAELASPEVPDAEKLLALKFVMHFVGDLHQPLHASDNLDRGGNAEMATVAGGTPMPLHAHWDTTFVTLVGAPAGGRNTDPAAVVAALRPPSDTEKAQWLAAPNPRYWAYESYALAQGYAYGGLPKPVANGAATVYKLDDKYVKSATTVVSDQLEKAGYRLAALLNAAFDR
jgi:hypothetical protein